ncbi:MAG: hypothetical protein JO033_15020 [Acidobacteriaceae bacterium]|nr:hypothetical protein [Acidobacteriaceae bacterium]MBV9500483.1 hypothetical protein [Acidobacteriaceae bacterium]
MKKVVFASLLTVSLCSFSALAAEMTGYISDAHCGAKHDKVSEANTKCINACLKGGSDAVFVHDGKVMKIDADSQAKAKGFAGQEVKVTGSQDNDTIKIDSIEKASM